MSLKSYYSLYHIPNGIPFKNLPAMITSGDHVNIPTKAKMTAAKMLTKWQPCKRRFLEKAFKKYLLDKAPTMPPTMTNVEVSVKYNIHVSSEKGTSYLF